MFNFSLNTYNIFTKQNLDVTNNLLTNQDKGTFILSKNDLEEVVLSFVDEDKKIEQKIFKRDKIQNSAKSNLDEIESFIKLKHLKPREGIKKDIINLLRQIIEQGKKNKRIFENIKLSEIISAYGVAPNQPQQRELLMEIVKLAVDEGGWPTSEFCQIFGLDPKNPEQRLVIIEIAKLAALMWGASKYIQNFGLDPKDPEQRLAIIEIAKLTARSDGGGTSEFIQNFGLDPKDPEQRQGLIEIAMIAASFHGGGTSEYIQNFGLDPKDPEQGQALIAIAKLAAQNNGNQTSKYIQNFGLDSKNKEQREALIEIAMIAVQNTGTTSHFIKNYGLDSKDPKQRQALIAIAKLAAQQNGESASISIQYYGLDPLDPEQRQALIAIAKLAAQQNGTQTSKYIQNFGLDSKDKEQREALIEIAMLAVQNSGIASRYIKNYGLDSKDPKQRQALIAIAKLAAQQNGEAASLCIKHYGLDPQDPEQRQSLIAIAKLAAQQNGEGTSLYIQKYGLNPQDPEQRPALIAIAKRAAKQNGEATSLHIQKYGLDTRDPVQGQALIAIAKFAAQQNGGGTSQNIQNYGCDPKDPNQREALIDIAKLAAQQDGMGTSTYIRKYGLDPKDPGQRQALIDIAKLSAQQNGEGASKYIKNYGLDPKDSIQREALIEIAKLSAWQNGEKTLIHLKRYKLNEMHEKEQKTLPNPDEKIRKLATLSYLSSQLSQIPLEELPDHLTSHFLFPKTLSMMQKSGATKEEALQELESFYKSQLKDRSPFEAFKAYLHKISQKKNSERHTVQAILWMAILSNTLTSVDSTWKKEELETILTAFANIQDPILRCHASYYWAADILPSSEKRDLYLSLLSKGKSKAMVLPSLTLAAFGEEQKDLAEIASLLPKIKSVSKNIPLKDAHFVHLWIKTCLATLLSPIYSPSFKSNLLKNIIEKEMSNKINLESSLSSLKGLLELKAEKKIQDFEKAPSLSIFLKDKYSEAFKEIIPLEKANAEEIENLFQQFRDPQTIFKYATALKKLPDSSFMLKELASCLENLLDKSYPACRYEGSKHLETVFGTSSSLKKEWMKERSSPLVVHTVKEEQMFNIADFIKQSFVEGHTDRSYYPMLDEYLQGNKETKQTEKSASFALEMALIDLIEKPSDEGFEKVFRRLPKEGEKTYAIQFDADIRGLKQQYKQWLNKEDYQGWTIVNTDNAADLFACGSEVEGSCQKVDGDPSLNKCLMAYVSDGKNRLLAVKNKEGKIIARSLMRLLWDEKEQKRVVFMERIYPFSAKLELQQALEREAIQFSEDLKIPLLSQSVGKGSSYPNPISSLGSKAPFEYVDSATGVTNGIYEILQAHLIKDV